VIDAPPPCEWPFRYPLCPELPAGDVIVHAGNVDDAYVNEQTAIQLVTTQKVYLDAEWSAALARHGRASLSTTPGHSSSITHPLARAFRLKDPAERLALCVDALRAGRTPAALVATASACMEVNDFVAAARDLDDAIAQSPAWAAAHYERGKLWLRQDDMVNAAESFQRAAELLPAFAPAWANLGGTLGELDRPDEALAAFERALAIDPASPQALNNVGVVRRELGRLAESEAAFRQVIALTPGMAFGHYNLGHTLFLQGRFTAALSAYVEGQARDPEKNPVQASRLALCKVATGDGAGAMRELQRATNGLPREYRRQLLADTSAILWALVTQHPELEGWQPVQAWVAAELGKL
jgi:Tfp pilus assembly protein PilF